MRWKCLCTSMNEARRVEFYSTNKMRGLSLVQTVGEIYYQKRWESTHVPTKWEEYGINYFLHL